MPFKGGDPSTLVQFETNEKGQHREYQKGEMKEQMRRQKRPDYYNKGSKGGCVKRMSRRKGRERRYKKGTPVMEKGGTEVNGMANSWSKTRKESQYR